MIPGVAAETVPLAEVERAGPALRELHAWLLERGFPELERYPWPGHLASLYHDPGILFRYLLGRSNSWRASAIASRYYTRLRRSRPALWVLCRTFMLCEPLPACELEKELTREWCGRLQEARILAAADGSYASCVRATPWQGRVLWHDAPPAFRNSFAFLGADSLTFARYLARWLGQRPGRRYARALDLCTGVGIHALMLAKFADEVVGVDVNPRALAYARMNAALQEVTNCSFVMSDLYANTGETPYDLIVSNPPLVFLRSDQRERCVDGDGGALGIGLVLRMVEGLARHLTPDGTAIFHANSPVVDGRDLLVEGLCELLAGERWTITLTPTHEFQDAALYAFYRAHRIQRFVTYLITLQAGQPFRVRRGRLAPWRKAACALRIAAIQAHGRSGGASGR